MMTLDALTTIAGGPLVDRLAWTLFHSLWQGAALGTGAWIVMRGLASARARYAAGVAALAAMVAVAVATFAALAPAAGTQASQSGRATADAGLAAVAIELHGSGALGALAAPGASQRPAAFNVSSVVVVAWLAGMAIFAVRLAGGWLIVRRLRTRSTASAGPAIEAIVRALAGRLGLTRAVRVATSSAVNAPALIGWLKPVVLLPASALTGLSSDQLEALIAHELAHVRRHDYLVNVLQSIAETVFFYHPAAWWLSREIRREREHCCDDLVLTVSDRTIYVSALTEMAALGAGTRLALGAADGRLFDRIRRILEGAEPHRASAGWAALPIAALAVAFVPVAAAVTRSPEPPAMAAGTTVALVRGEPLPPLRGASAPQRDETAVGARAGQAAPTAPADTRSLQVAGAEEEALRQRVRDAEAQLQRLMDEAYELEAARTMAEHDAHRDEATRRLEMHRAELARLRAAQAPAERLAEARAAVLRAEAELRAVVVEADYRKKAAELAAAQRRQQREHQRLAQELARLEQAMHQKQRALEFQAQAEAGSQLALQKPPIDLDPSLVDLEHELQRQIEELNRSSGEAVHVPAVAPAGATARAGDVVTVEIEGESALPRGYLVSPDGSIRLPLIGPVSVAGKTSNQIQETVREVLADRQLAVGRRITATLHRD